MTKRELKEFLDEKVIQYNNPKFIESDPISIPHQFTKKEDIEISAFLVATIAWGQRKTIINNGNKLMELMGNSPHDFVMNYKPEDFDRFQDFKHRTFNPFDLEFFIKSLRNIYKNHQGLEAVFAKKTKNSSDCFEGIDYFRNTFFELNKEEKFRTFKHVSSPAKGSAAKRLVMFLRWMVRDDKNDVDFGIWKSISSSKLSCPLDVHSGNVARKLGLLNRTQNDLRAVKELDINLRKMDKNDPAKYDFALFGLGVFEGF